ncbi:BRO1 domain-containing protein BROX-like isoform X2 [Ischnura elegans]|uniref:BRO1 domain-containing protein BROX-like isoform X2 n=1 Tax=Ischnura elegans TaxID=197161 RepID=UPI001ED873CC|nr:BRO1 domain-containing protein BROX-like isoform X2 [Ischnura elegans]
MTVNEAFMNCWSTVHLPSMVNFTRGMTFILACALKDARQKLLLVIVDPHQPSADVEELLKNYLSLLTGFLLAIDEKQEESNDPSKLRNNFIFKWTHTLLGNVPQSVHDAFYEAASMSINVAIWHMKHASMIAAGDHVSLVQSKEVHSELKLAASIFKFVEDFYLPRFLEKPMPGSDFDPKVLKAFINQSIAEAQEVTVARAIELKHNPNIIAGIANETSKRFLSAFNSLEGVREAAQWRTYLKLKSLIYLSFAYCFFGETLLSQDKCGDAMRALQESQTCHKQALEWCKEYGKIKSPDSKIKPESHLFFRRLASIVELSLNKCERENCFIYHQKVPAAAPQLETEANFGLVEPDSIKLPGPNPLWKPSVYAAFPCKTLDKKDIAATAAASKLEELPPVKEVPIKHTERDQKNKSGCVIQ